MLLAVLRVVFIHILRVLPRADGSLGGRNTRQDRRGRSGSDMLPERVHARRDRELGRRPHIQTAIRVDNAHTDAGHILHPKEDIEDKTRRH